MSRARPAVALLPLALLASLALAASAPAAEQMIGLDGDPAFPPIPDVFDLELTEKEWAKIQDGEIITQIVERGAEDRQARAIGYLKATPTALFDIATDSALAPEIVSEVEEVTVLEHRERGKMFRGRADFSFVMPVFEYTLVSAYDDTRTGQCWAQVEGDFDKNEGTHAFFWDPERQETLAVMTFDFALKGILSMVPEWILVRIAKQTLPDFMRKVDEMTVEMAEREPDRAERVAEEWARLKPELEAGLHPRRTWQGFPLPPPPEDAVVVQRVAPATTTVAADTGTAEDGDGVEEPEPPPEPGPEPAPEPPDGGEPMQPESDEPAG